MILIIEDDVVSAHIITAVLKRGRAQHIVAETAAAAREAVAQHPIDLIICDMHLPDGDGLDLIEEFMVKPHLQDIPVVFCTTTPDMARVERALGLGAVDFLKKPINVDSFASRLDRALTRAPQRWESWRELTRRLKVDSRTFPPLLRLVRDDLADVLQQLALVAGDGAPDDDVHTRVQRLRGAAVNVGALRTAQMIDFLWSGKRASDAGDLHDALIPELRSFDNALAARGTAFFAPTTLARN
ncbi:MAG: response regulator [Gemmatimonadaceae bacterium]|nr:response regulator [Gemmatimonadaceae bacterium]